MAQGAGVVTKRIAISNFKCHKIYSIMAQESVATALVLVPRKELFE
jgi:hypothetical protein